ncbi:MAG: DUF2779 domain-containing protein [Gammaproteobacteria bacterium]|nr:DUF2779 domain-containing protein [Gammaproteobacteria bacterium]
MDLHRIVRRHYYHPGFRGSLSLKTVLPTMTHTHYDDLAIADGRLASVRYMEALRTSDEAVRSQTFADLGYVWNPPAADDAWHPGIPSLMEYVRERVAR